MKGLFTFLFFFYFLFSFASAQQRQMDSLQSALKTVKEDTNKVNLLNALSERFKEVSNYDSSLIYATTASRVAEKLDFKKGLAIALRSMAVANWSKSNYPLALDYATKALKLNEEIKNETGIAADYSSISAIYEEEGDYPKALDYILKSLTICQALNNKQSIATDLSNIAVIYTDMENPSKALDYALNALTIYESIKDTNNIARSRGNLGSIYIDQENYTKAIECDSIALALYCKTNNKDGVAINLGNLGIIYEDENNLVKALQYNFKALALYKEIGDNSGIAYTLIDIGSIYTKRKNYNDAQKYLDSALNVSKKIGSKLYIQLTYGYRSTLDSTVGNNKASLEDFKNYIIYRDSLVNEANTKKTVQSQMNYDFEQKQAAQKAAQDKKDIIAEQERKKQIIIRDSFISGFLLMIALAFLIFRGLKEKQKANTIITKQKEEVEKQKELVEHQKAIVDEKNKDITDSIHYASRIQRALLTTDEYIGKHLNDYFILFKPRDIVSGDFYWAFAENNKSNVIHFACCDCTGHGVPGAFMSLLNISMLNETVIERNITSPDLILNDIRNNIIKALNPKGLDTESKDGMDCSLVAFDFEQKVMQVACANNPIWIVRGGESVPLVEEIGPDKMPVGVHYGEQKPFTLHNVKLNKGDSVYLFTDGYADQFGGPKGKKFKYKQLQEMLLAVSHQPMAEQKKVLNETLGSWKGNLEQVDDVLIIGIKIG
jgi:serine phosphatase RsbU (regulator of sigma subunit)